MSLKKLLVASTDPERLQSMLKSEGHVIVPARSFQETASLVSRMNVDLLVLDAALSDRSGSKAARDLRALGLRLPPMLLVCPAAELEAHMSGGPRLADEFLVEGFAPSELRLRVRLQLETRLLDGEMLQIRDSFVDMLVYDLRAPLASVMVGLEYLVSEEHVPVSAKKVVETLSHNCADLDLALQNFLDLERREEDGFKLLKTEIDPRRLLSKSVASLKPALAVRRIELEFEGTAPLFQGDERWLKRLIQGLTLSAGKLSAPGTTVSLRCGTEGDAIKLWVRYRGQPIPPDAVAKLFDRYFHRETGGWIFPRGVGLALGLCRKVVEAHLGRIAVETAEDGSSFVVLLPAA